MNVPRHDTLTALQNRLAEKLGPQKYKVWFKNATQLSIAGGLVRVSCPNNFISTWIERNFADTILDVVREVTGQVHQIAFHIEPRLQQGLGKRQLNSQADFVARHPERMARECLRQGTTPTRSLRGRFDQLVVGPANQLAVSLLRAIAEQPVGLAAQAQLASHYSPIFVHGGCGLGKTHLLQALANELADRRPDCKWAYLTGDEFTNQFILAVRSNNVESFRQRYRHLDVLIIDDIHFLANKKATQEEFLHTFNAIDTLHKTIVLTSDTHPKLIGQFSEPLINRFLAGVVVKLEVPDYAMRCAILRQKADLVARQPVPDEVIAYIAGHLKANIRELEGALLKLVMFQAVSHQPITLSLARRALADHLHRTQRMLGLDEIDQTVATYFGLTPADLHTSRKSRTIALARGIAMFLARKHTDMSFPEIGRFMGNKNHSTVILANRKIAGLWANDEVVSRQTPAGISQEPIRQIVATLEQQLGLATVPADAALNAPGQPLLSSRPAIANNRPVAPNDAEVNVNRARPEGSAYPPISNRLAVG